jgi:hypothetical protein
MSVQVGTFFELVVLRSAIDNAFTGGAQAFVSKLGIGEVTDDFVVWGTMGQDNILNVVREELEVHGLNCDDDDADCVYIETAFHAIPRKQRNWLTAEKDDNGKAWLYLKQ